MATVGSGVSADQAAFAQREHRKKAEFNQRRADVLMIGSQVIYGSVGLSAALPVLQNEGLRVLAVPTIVLSSMPHYSNSHRAPHDAQWLEESLNDLVVLGLIDEISTIATGYFASTAQVQIVAKWIKKIRESHPHINIVVDPTIGDIDVGVYTSPGIAAALAQDLMPLATGLLPNGFEFSHFVGDTNDPVSSARQLLGAYGEWIVITSFNANNEVIDLLITRDDAVELKHPLISTEAKGAGDVFAAAFVAAIHKKMTLIDAAHHAALTVRTGLNARAL